MKFVSLLLFLTPCAFGATPPTGNAPPAPPPAIPAAPLIITLESIRDFPLRNLKGFVPASVDRPHSALFVGPKHKGKTAAATSIFLGQNGVYRATLVTMAEPGGRSTYTLKRGIQEVETFRNPLTNREKKAINHTIEQLPLRRGDPITVTFTSSTDKTFSVGGKPRFANGYWTRLELVRIGPLEP